MNQSLTIKVKGIEPVLIEHSGRARRISISIRPNLGVRVAVPHGVHFDKAIEFVRLQRPWIEKQLRIMKHHEAERSTLAEPAITVDRTKAGRKLTGRLDKLAKGHGFSFGKVSIKNQKTRWGSCSRNNNLSLNVKLALLPEDLVDYVILHELVHTRIHDHGKDFWKELDRYVGNSKALATRLRKYGYSLP